VEEVMSHGCFFVEMSEIFDLSRIAGFVVSLSACFFVLGM